jgi:hypothetical protein
MYNYDHTDLLQLEELHKFCNASYLPRDCAVIPAR